MADPNRRHLLKYLSASTLVGAMSASPLAASANPWVLRVIWRLLVGRGRALPRRAPVKPLRATTSKAVKNRQNAGWKIIDNSLLALDVASIVMLTPELAHALEAHNNENPSGPRPEIWLKDGVNPYYISGINILNEDISDKIHVEVYSYSSGSVVANLESFLIKVRAGAEFNVGTYAHLLPEEVPFGEILALRAYPEANNSIIIDDSGPILIADSYSVYFDDQDLTAQTQ